MQQLMHLFKYRWNTVKSRKSHTLEIAGMQPVLPESNSLLNVNEASPSDFLTVFPCIYFYLSSAANFFFPSSGCKTPGDLQEQMWYLRFCTEQSGCFENIHSKASYNTRCESSKAASCVYILISPARKAGVFMHWKLTIQTACSNNLLLLYGAFTSRCSASLLCRGPTHYKTETPTGL